MGEALALVSALFFGTAHFLSGLLARRLDSSAVALIGQLGGTALMLLVAPWSAAPHISGGALGWGALSGVGTGIGVAFLYRGVSGGRFSVVVPLSDVAAVALPVLIGVALLGDRPQLWAWYGIAAAPPALWLIARSGRADEDGSDSDSDSDNCSSDSRRGRGIASGAHHGLAAGLGFALQFVALAQADPAAGLWPLVAGRAASVLVLLPLVARRPARPRLSAGSVWGCLIAGSLGTLGITLYTLATREQLLSLTVVLTALYPAVPVLLGVAVLRERLTRLQGAGLVCAAASMALISLS
ncbi:EamA family transporter [Streptomyces smyrnaeus]|uniref:EamA family transporter n=1 Tax=Streptomyces smyrnaeus TaxID=1387713 RepID=UPI00160FDA10